MKAIPYHLRKNATPHPESMNSVPTAEMPGIVITNLHLQLRRAIFEVSAQGERELMLLNRETEDAIMRVLERCVEQAEQLFEGGAYPDRSSDEDLLILSYKLPVPLALALLRKRLIRGLTLRRFARAAEERRAAPRDD